MSLKIKGKEATYITIVVTVRYGKGILIRQLLIIESLVSILYHQLECSYENQ